MANGIYDKAGTTSRRFFCGSVSLLALIGHGAALAQVEEESGDEQYELEEIVVTGSRITRKLGDTVAPIMTLDSERLLRSGKTNIEDFVSEFPALIGSSGSFETNEQGALTGVNFLNLRNLGTNRTLVLVNGRRHVGADATGVPSVDTNSVPTALIDRVEVLTGGASAIYGADGVSGVVNFILKQDFEGLAVRGQAGMSDRADAADYFSAVTWGANFAGGRGNVTASFEFRKNDSLRLEQRSFGLEDATFLTNNPLEFGQEDLPDVPDQVISRDLRFVFTAPSGRYDISGFDTVTGTDLEFGDLILNNRGEPFDEGTLVDGFLALGGDGTPVNRFTPEFFPKTNAYSFNQTAHYDFSDKVRAFTEFKYTQTNARNPGEPSFTSYLTLSLDNPFIPQQFRDALSTIEDPFINLARDDIELRPIEDNRRETFRGVAGIRGDLTDWLKYELSFNRGVTKVKAKLENLRREDRYFAAIDAVTDPATGQPTCRSNLDPTAVPPTDPVVSSYNPDVFGDPAHSTFTPGPNSGCIPFNPFVSGLDDPSVNAAALDFITGSGVPVIDRGKMTQTVLTGFLSGDTSGLGLELPAGPISYVLGGEYRKEKTLNDVSDLRNDPNALTFFAVEQDVRAAFDVSEAFVEISVPIFKDLGPLLQSLRLDGAYRFSDYSTIGSTNTYSFGGNWELDNQVTIRGSYARSVRAPNLSELFSPDNEAFFGPEDPCNANNLDAQSANTIANCITALTALGIDPATFIPSSAVNRSGVIGGNPDLQEETSKTWTIGLVLQPEFLPGFAATFDAWRIRLADGVLFPDPDEIVEQCFDAPSLDNQFCELFTRDAGGIIEDLRQTPVNVSSLLTSGFDFSVRYDHDLGGDAGFLSDLLDGDAGSLSFNLSGSYLRKLITQATLAPIRVDEAGQVDTLLGGKAPKWVLNFDMTWRHEALSVNYGINYESGLNLFDKAELERDPDISSFLRTKRLLLHDIQFAYDLSDRLSVYAGVNNIADRKPDPTFLNTPVGPTGRFLYVGLELSFDSLANISNPFR